MARQGVLERARDLAATLVDVAEPVSFVHDDEIPGHGPDGVRLGAREVVGADEDLGRVVQRLGGTGRAPRFQAAGIEDERRDEELLLQLLHPLVSQRGGNDGQDTPAALGPELADDEAGLDGLPEPNLVGQEGAVGQRRAEREEGSVDLVGVQVDRGVQQR